MAQASNQTELQRALDQREPQIDIIADFTLESQITINYEVVIQSLNVSPVWTLTRQSGYMGNLFSVETPGSLTLRYLILDGDKAGTQGVEPIIRTVHMLTMEYVTIQNNAANNNGGGVYIDGEDAIVNMNNSTFHGCECSKGKGGAIYCYKSNPTISRCTFDGNVGHENCAGGGMANEESSPVLTDCVFINNTAATGGAMFNAYGSNPTLVGCVFQNNRALTFDGGGVWINHGAPRFISCTFKDNTASGEGGGFYSAFCSLTLFNCVFTGNQAGEYGGAIFSENSDNTFSVIYNCNFMQNMADSGGAVCFEIGSSLIAKCVFKHNSALSVGGAIFQHHQISALDDCIIESNKAKYGGGIYQTSGTFTLNSGCLYCNEALLGGGIFVESMNASTPAVTALSGVEVFYNSAQTGGAAYVQGYSNFVFDSGKISQNSASKDGGGVYTADGGQMHLIAPAVLCCNSAANDSADIYNGGALGISGAVYIQSGVLLPSDKNLILVEGSLAGACVKMEESSYLYPDRAKAPIDIAVGTTAYPVLTEADSAAFIKPSSGFDGWNVHLNHGNSAVCLDFPVKPRL